MNSSICIGLITINYSKHEGTMAQPWRLNLPLVLSVNILSVCVMKLLWLVISNSIHFGPRPLDPAECGTDLWVGRDILTSQRSGDSGAPARQGTSLSNSLTVYTHWILAVTAEEIIYDADLRDLMLSICVRLPLLSKVLLWGGRSNRKDQQEKSKRERWLIRTLPENTFRCSTHFTHCSPLLFFNTITLHVIIWSTLSNFECGKVQWSECCYNMVVCGHLIHLNSSVVVCMPSCTWSASFCVILLG